jgi:hypothetical protein
LEWILGAKGHGREWGRVFHVGPEDWELVWRALAKATLGAAIKEVRDRSPYGISCGVEVFLAINDREARTFASWHYAIPLAAPRLVTAYPTP